jgi:dihydropyrimidinase
MADINIVNGEVFIPEQGIKYVGLSLSDGKIIAIADNDHLPSASETIDASGLMVIPGIIDPHVHLGYCQDFETDCRTETRSALLGGVTTIGCYLGGTELYSKKFPELENIINTHAFTDVFPHICISTEEQKQEIPEYIKRFGLTSFKFFMFCIPGYMPSQTNSFILSGFREVAKFGPDCFCSIHAEDSSLILAGWNEFFKKEKASLTEWADCNPDEAEELGVIIASSLAEMSQCRINIVHLATSAALKRFKAIRLKNHFINVETIALYLTLNSSNHVNPIEARWSPAIRRPEDQESLWEGVRDGTISTIGTDQDCVTRSGLKKFIKEYGVSGSSAIDAIFLPLLLTEGYHKRNIPLENLLDKITINPARLWGIYPKKGTIAIGSDADLVLMDLNKDFIVDSKRLHSASDWSLYQGKKLTGQPIMTIKNGKVVMKEGEILEDEGKGKRLRRTNWSVF